MPPCSWHQGFGSFINVCCAVMQSDALALQFGRSRGEAAEKAGGVVGRLCRLMGDASGGSGEVTCIGVCASAAGLLRMMLATGQ